MLTKILVFTCYHSDDDRVRLSVKDFWAVSSLFDTFSYRKKQFCFIAHNKLNPFFIILISIVRLLNVQFTLIVRFLWHCNTKNTRHRVKPLLKKRGKSEKRGALGKRQFCREKKNGRVKEEKKKPWKNQDGATGEIWLSCAWCVSNIGLNFRKTLIFKDKCIYDFPLELKSRAE